MRTQSYAGAPGTSLGRPQAANRVSIVAIAEQPAGIDEPLAKLFRDMRRVTGLDARTLAARLDTFPHLLAVLEAGDLRALALGPELDEFIVRYARFLRVEPRPILDRIYSAAQPLSARTSARTPAERPDQRVTRVAALPAPHPVSRLALPAPARASHQPAETAAARGPVANDPDAASRRARRRRRVVRTLLAIVVPLAGLLALWWLSTTPALRRALSVLPEPASRAARAGLEHVVRWTAPERDGLRWIEVEDPRSRKSDKLPARPR